MTLKLNLSRCAPGLVAAVLSAGCAAPAGAPRVEQETKATPVYNKQTGRLEQLVSDRDGDGKPDTRAFMDGPQVKSIEIDRDGDGKPDRWEYYLPAPAGQPGPPSVLDRVEEAKGVDLKIARREFYVKGILSRTEEDTDGDGRTDKWEFYEKDVLARVELDLEGHGRPDRRLVYADGNVVRVEVDPDGDGKFEPVTVTPAKKGGGQ